MLETVLRSIIKEGAIAVRGPDGRVCTVGGVTEDSAPLLVHVRTHAALARIGRRPGLGVGESYMDGDLVIERGSLYDLLAVGTRNLPGTRKRRLPLGTGRPRNPPRASRRNVAHHYDLSCALFRLFLDEDLQYSCAYFPHPGMTLDEAQGAKKRYLAAKLLLEPGQRVLDIGSGWGGLALTLAQDHGVEVLGVTLSTEQLETARLRAAQRGLDRVVRFDLQDYRAVQGKFDRIVSVGMFEHVGPADYDAYFDTMSKLLDDRGIAVLHTIGRINGPGGGNPWIEKYIFPGGTIPALSEIIPAIERSGLLLTDVEVLRMHYAETLKIWRERFAARRDEARKLYDERFCRMWEFYLAGAEAGFRVGDLVVFQLQLAKDRAAAPITRDYIAEFERSDAEGSRIAAE